MLKIEFTTHSKRQFKKLPKDIQKRIVAKLEFFLAQPNILDFAEPLTDSRLGKYRFRIGNYRIAFDIEENILVVHDVGNRKEIYK